MIFETIAGRKSVRTYDGTGIREEDLEKLKQYMTEIDNPFGIPVEFFLLDAEQYELSSPVVLGEKYYAAGKVEKKDYADVAFGYSFEKLVLYAWSLGIGTEWIGGTMRRQIFEKAVELGEGEMMPCVSPLGYPAKKPAIREAVMRKSVGADTRRPPEKFFYDKMWNLPVSGALREELSDLIEAVRWAPSAANKQPWRIILRDGAFHFYEKKDKGFTGEAVGDMQKIDIGIALCHFILALEEKGEKPEVVIKDPCVEIPDDADYIATVLL